MQTTKQRVLAAFRAGRKKAQAHVDRYDALLKLSGLDARQKQGLRMARDRHKSEVEMYYKLITFNSR